MSDSVDESPLDPLYLAWKDGKTLVRAKALWSKFIEIYIEKLSNQILDRDKLRIIELFCLYYQSPDGEPKYNQDEIMDVYAGKHPTLDTPCVLLNIQYKQGSVTAGKGNLRAKPSPQPSDPQLKKNMRKAYRNAIASQITEYRLSAVGCVSPSHESDDSEYEIDHIHPFESLVVEFEQNKGHLFSIYDEECGQFVLPEPLRTDWSRFHQNKARLQKLCKKCHARKTKEQQMERSSKQSHGEMENSGR